MQGERASRPAPAMETPKPYCPCDGHALNPNSYSNDSAPAARCAFGKATAAFLVDPKPVPGRGTLTVAPTVIVPR